MISARGRSIVTAFDAFGGLRANVSATVVEGLATVLDIDSEVLPTSYVRAGARIEELLLDHRPMVLLMLGFVDDAIGLRLEQIALNLDDADGSDNDGVRRRRVVIAPDAPVAYRSSLPLEGIATQLVAAGVPVEWSHDAGGFVCNHVYFRAAHCTATHGLDCAVGFIHIPAPDDTLTVDEMTRAVAVVLSHIGVVAPVSIESE
jgi:pyroglutamyl-peptidase